MAEKSDPRAPGIWLALSVLGGGFVGAWLGQVSIGILTGLALGLALCLGFWLYDKK